MVTEEVEERKTPVIWYLFSINDVIVTSSITSKGMLYVLMVSKLSSF